jgi:4-hydroxybenzoate polyprenyltransferase
MHGGVLSRIVSGRAGWTSTAANYVHIARPDHWTKHVFIVPGIILAYALKGDTGLSVMPIFTGLISAAALSSANYVLNEWLDRELDAHHPKKSKRTAVTKTLDSRIVYTEYTLLLAVGLFTAFLVSALFMIAALAFAIAGIIYNVRPFRTKDRAYLDVLSEALNNPIRLVLGWAMVDSTTLPPSSALIAYWMGGAFLMGSKRLSEYREIVTSAGRDVLVQYRQSFMFYDEKRLLVSVFLYAILASFFIAIFLLKYRIEYIIALPAFAMLFAFYLSISLDRDSVAQKPERLFRHKRLMAMTCVTVIVVVALTFVDIPMLQYFSDPHLISFGR